MANGWTLGDVKTLGLDLADMTNSGFAVDARLTDYANAGLRRLHDLLIGAGYAAYLQSENTFSVVGGTESYSLPTDFYKVLACFYIADNNRRYPMWTWHPLEIGGYKTSPASSASVLMYYVPQMTRLSDDADVIPVHVPVAWEEYVATYIAMKLKEREESDHTQFLTDLREMGARFKEAAEPRDLGRPGSPVDVYSRWNSSSELFPETRDIRYRVMGDNIHFIEHEFQGV